MNFLKTLLVAAIAVFAPIQGVITTVLVLTMIDLITGLCAARKRQEKITSRGLRRTVAKILVYEIACACAFLTQLYLTGPLLPCLSLLTTLIGVVELKSILENLDTCYGESIFKAVISGLMSGQEDKKE